MLRETDVTGMAIVPVEPRVGHRFRTHVSVERRWRRVGKENRVYSERSATVPRESTFIGTSRPVNSYHSDKLSPSLPLLRVPVSSSQINGVAADSTPTFKGYRIVEGARWIPKAAGRYFAAARGTATYTAP